MPKLILIFCSMILLVQLVGCASYTKQMFSFSLLEVGVSSENSIKREHRI